jgi:hypothetical protein
MKKLFCFKPDCIDNSYPEKIYSEDMNGAVARWIEILDETKYESDFNLELCFQIEGGEISDIKKMHDSDSYYLFNITNGTYNRTIYIQVPDTKPDFIANIHYYSTEDGGRKGFVLSGYRSQIKFPFNKNMISGEQIFIENDKVCPGEKVTVQITILDHTQFRKSLSVGTIFKIYEGLHEVAEGEIVEIVNGELKLSTS